MSLLAARTRSSPGAAAPLPEAAALRTGTVVRAGDEPAEGAADDAADEVTARMLCILLVMKQRAVTLAETLAVHAEREDVGLAEIDAAIKALVYKGALFADPTLDEAVERTMNELYFATDSDNEASGEEVEEEDGENEDDGEDSGGEEDSGSASASGSESDNGSAEGSEDGGEETEEQDGDDGIEPMDIDVAEFSTACACDTCRGAQRAVRDWPTWEPDDEILVFLRNCYNKSKLEFESLTH